VDLRDSAAVTEFQVKNIRAFIGKAGSEKLKYLDKNVRVVIDNGPLPNAFANSEADPPVITIGAGYALNIVYLSELMLLSNRSQAAKDCSLPYSVYLAEATRKQIMAKSNGEQVPEVLAPEIYALQDKSCAGVRQLYPFPAELKPARERLLYQALGFTYLHELGHISFKRHFNMAWKAMPEGHDKLCAYRQFAVQSRRSETEADIWATHTLFELNSGEVALNVPLWQYLSVTSGMWPGEEIYSDHPNGIHRQVAVLRTFRQEYESRGGTLPQTYSDLFTAMMAFSQKADATLNIPDPVTCDG
jgi:hypothetical protein